MKCTIVLFILTIISIRGYSQEAQLPDPEPYFMAVIVSDIDSSISWYAHKLGFEVIDRVELEARGIRQANLKRGDALVELIESVSAVNQKSILKKNPEVMQIEGYFKFGFSISNFDTWIDYLTRTGVEIHGGIVMHNTTRKKMIIIKDPDGNRIQLFEK